MSFIQQVSEVLGSQAWPSPATITAWLAVAIMEVSVVAIALLLWRLIHIMEEAVRVMRAANHDVKEHPTTVGPTTMVDDLREESVSDRSSEMDDSESPLRHSAEQFKHCLLGDSDIDVRQLMNACYDYMQVLSVMGKFAKSLRKQVDGNMDKISSGLYRCDPDKYASMKALLQAENDADKHKPDAVLADPSAAMGLLWMRRALMFWNALYDKIHKTEGKDVELKEYGAEAYEQTLRPFNGFISRQSFKSMVLSRMPGWGEVRPKLSPKATIQADMSDWMDIVSKVIERMEAIQKEANLEDLRKSI